MKLKQRILVTTTSPLRGFIFRMEATTVVDVVNGWVHLGKGHWGACPSRELKNVVESVKDIDPIINGLKRLRELRDSGTTKKVLYGLVENGGGLEIQEYVFNKSIDSLRNGKYDSYTNRVEMGINEIRVINNNPKKYVYNTFEEAITNFKEVAEQKYLDKLVEA